MTPSPHDRPDIHPCASTSRPPDDPRNGPVMLRRTLVQQGWNDRAIGRMLRDGAWAKVRRGAYADGPTWRQLDETGRHGLRARAVQQQAQTKVVLSHVSGLGEYDAPTWGLDLSDVHITRRDGKVGRHEAGVHQHCGRIIAGDVEQRNGVDVMAPTRLALEVTTVATVESALVVVNDLSHRGLTSLQDLRQRYAQSMERWPRTLTTDLVLRLADPRIESVGESRTFYLLFGSGLPMPVLQYPIRDASGRIIARVDFAWPDLGVFLEFDGKVKYEGLLKEGQRASDVVIAEKQREQLICRLTGWRCVRITWADLAQPARTTELLRDALFPAAPAA